MPKSSFEDHLQSQDCNIAITVPATNFCSCVSGCTKCWRGRWLCRGPCPQWVPTRWGKTACGHKQCYWVESPAQRRNLFTGRRERQREELVKMKIVNSGVTAEQPHLVQRKELFLALLTCCLSLPTVVGIKGRRYIIQLYPSCFA